MKSPLKTLALLASLVAVGAPAWAQHDATGDLASTKLEARKVLAELNEIEKERYAASQEVESIQGEIDALEGSRASHEDALDEAQVAVADRARSLRTRIRLLYRLNRTGFLRILFSSEDPADLRKRTKYLVNLLRETRGQVQDFMDEVGVKRDALGRLEDDRARLLSLQSQAEERRARLSAEERRQKRLLEEINGRKELALQVLRERATSGGFMEEDFATGGGSTITVTEAPRSQGFRDLQGRLSYPVSGRLMRSYGNYTDDATGEVVNNPGIDIRAENYAPIRCVADGYVQYAGFLTGYGMTVVVDHGGEYATVYAHASKLNVDGGQQVREGEVLGMVGETGVTDNKGPRLRFEVRYRRTPQNPLDWLSAK